MKWITRKGLQLERVILALIVRAADIKGQEHVAPEGVGLRAIADGCQRLGLSDEERLAKQFPMYDALFEYCRKSIQRQSSVK